MKIYDTIAAISTPVGKGAISIVRLSGNDTLNILKKIFVPDKNKNLDSPGVYKGKIIEGKKILDEVIVVLFLSPHSFTGEDIAEIHCHGNVIVTEQILKSALKNGARLAKPGEFTFRAFINKKIDLTQAEAINELINAKTEKAKDLALSNLFGKLSKYVQQIDDTLKDLLVQIEVALDHPDEEIEFIQTEKIETSIREIIEKIEKLLETSQAGKSFQYGITIPIVGKTNVGKSSLFNALLKKDKAIVSETPGTTRDLIEDWININGLPVKLVDTAGYKNSIDLVEKIALNKTEKIISESTLIIAMFDASSELQNEDFKLIEKLKNIPDARILFLLNKIDLPLKIDLEKLEKIVKSKLIKISALKNTGIQKLEKSLYKMVVNKDFSSEDVIITNIRYETLLNECKNYLTETLKAIKNKLPLEIIASEIRRALNSLETITGKFTTEDLLNSIFSNFCIGK